MVREVVYSKILGRRMGVERSVSPMRERVGPWWRARASILRSWIHKAAEGAPDGWALKTDLFDEASGPHHHAGDLGPRHRFLGIDADLKVVRAAQRRLSLEGRQARLVVCDVRELPFAAGTLALVLSLSTLDHFEDPEDIEEGLGELMRAMDQRGVMLLTMDNPCNPEVALRARLPDWLLRRLRADSFPLGATLAPGAAEAVFQELGLSIREREYLIHAPRYPLMRLVGFLERRGAKKPADGVERVIRGLEGLGRLPVRALSGHYASWILSPEEARSAQADERPEPT